MNNKSKNVFVRGFLIVMNTYFYSDFCECLTKNSTCMHFYHFKPLLQKSLSPHAHNKDIKNGVFKEEYLTAPLGGG